MPLLHASWSTRQLANMHKDLIIDNHKLDVDLEEIVQGGFEGGSISPKDTSSPLSSYHKKSSAEIRGLNVDRDMIIGRIKKEQSPKWSSPSGVSLQNITT